MRWWRNQLAKVGAVALICGALACRASQTAPNPLEPPRGAPTGAVIDLGTDEERTELITGFHAAESVERRRASWSDGDSSEIAFSLRGTAKRHVLALLGEPYFAIQPVSIRSNVNGKEIGAVTLDAGWKGYALLVEPGIAREGDNTLTLHYSKTGQPSVIEASSTDVRELSVRLDEIQLQPIIERVRLVFDMHNARLRAALTEGWAVDANDPSPGLWSVGPRASLAVYLEPRAGKDYWLELTGHSQGGVPVQNVAVRMNESALGELTFYPRKSAQRLLVPAAAVRERNEIVFEIKEPKSPSNIDPKSSDQRLLGVRALRLELLPH